MRDDVRARSEADIQAHGQHVVGVACSSGDPAGFLPFAYTVGNQGRGLPELLLIGDSGEVYARILNLLGQVWRDNLGEKRIASFRIPPEPRLGCLTRMVP